MATTKPRKATATPTPAPTPPAPSPAPAAAGVPRWVPILVALVPVGGLVWAVVTHFVPKVEPPKPPAPPPVAATAPAREPVSSVSVSGSGNVGVGGITGGTINNGGGSGAPTGGSSSVPNIVEIFPGKYVITTPPKIAIGSSDSVELRLNLNKNQFNTIDKRVTISGSTKTYEDDFTHDLTAHLESTGFTISPDKPIRQKVLEGTKDTVWMWVISPKQKGRQQLLLSITSALPDGSTMKPTVREVEVIAGADETSSATFDFLRTNWKELLTLIFIPLGGLIWRYLANKKINPS